MTNIPFMPALKPSEQRVFAIIYGAGEAGATIEEIALEMEVPDNRVSPRVTELHEAGYIKVSGKTRRTRCGRQAECWVVVDVPTAQGALL
jgi:Mn-dependent DtxR family transcriptional regulator